MRHQRHPSASASPSPSAGSYDWSRFGRHRLRAVAATMLDHPVGGGSVATLCADPSQPGEWSRLPWQPAATGGWNLPTRLALGDVVEFGHGNVKWWGIVDSYVPDAWLTVQGPYPNPAAAARDADHLLGAERYMPPLKPDHPRRVAEACIRRRQRTRRHP
jgi:hypothetical protein